MPTSLEERKTVNVVKYQVTFVPYPANPSPGENSTTLNFSVLENNMNIYNINSAVTIAKKGSGETISNFRIEPMNLVISQFHIPFKTQGTMLLHFMPE